MYSAPASTFLFQVEEICFGIGSFRMFFGIAGNTDAKIKGTFVFQIGV